MMANFYRGKLAFLSLVTISGNSLMPYSMNISSASKPLDARNGFDDEGEYFGFLDDTARVGEQISDVLPLTFLGQSESPFFAPCLIHSL